MEIVLLYYMVFCAVMFGALLLARIPGPAGPQWQLTPEFTLAASFLFYTSAMPISRVFWGTPGTDLDIAFLQTHTLAGLGIICGLYMGKYLAPERLRPERSGPPNPMSPIRCVAFAGSAFLAVGGFIYSRVGFDVSNLLTPYGFEQSISTSATGSTFEILAIPVAIATFVSCYYGAFFRHPPILWLRRLVIALTILFTAALLVRGSRNLTVIVWAPIAVLALRGRRLPILKSVLVAAAAFFVFSAVAVIRNVGFGEAESQTVTSDNLDPLRGELGTSYNVYTIFDSIATAEDLRYGGTYVIDFVANLVPRVFWPNRPNSTAVKFSMLYYQTDTLEFGVGFSPVVEALTNFSIVGILPVFAAFSLLVVIAARYLRSKGRWGYLSYSMMVPMLVNGNRIDSNASGKMFLVYVLFFVVLDRLLYSVPADWGLRPVRAAGGSGYTPIIQVMGAIPRHPLRTRQSHPQ